MASEPTRGPVERDPLSANIIDLPDGTTITVDSHPHPDDAHDPDVLARESACVDLIAAAFNASTAARDLGFDAIGAIEALPLLLRACDDSRELIRWLTENFTHETPARVPPVVHELVAALSAARKRGDA